MPCVQQSLLWNNPGRDSRIQGHIFLASGQLFFLLVGERVAQTGRTLYPRAFIHTTGEGCAALTRKMCLNHIAQQIKGEMMMNLNKLALRN